MPTEIHLYLLRHAIAEERGSAWPDDDVRPLSREGIRKFKQASRGLARALPKVDTLLTSPLVRAYQTAEILAHALPAAPKIVPFEALRPDTAPSDAIAALRARSAKGSVVLVGHDPMLSELASALLHLQGPLEFKKGAAMAIVSRGLGTRGPARLDWYLTPKLLRSLARRAS